MATPPFTINEALPGDTDVVSQHPANARTFRDVTEDYLNTDHDFNTGHHNFAGLVEQGADPGTVANTGWLYTKDVAGATELFYKDHTGNVKQITTAGKLNVLAADIPINSIDGTKIALGSDALGDIMYYNGTDWVRLAAGTAGQLLQTNGAAAPTWVTVVGYEVKNTRSNLTSPLNDQGGSSATFYPVTGLSAAIASVAAGNDVRVRGHISISCNIAGVHAVLRVKRDATVLTVGGAAGSRTPAFTGGNPGANQTQTIHFDILDAAPGAGSYTYTVEVALDQATTFNINQTDGDGDTATVFRTASVLDVAEIKR